MTSDLFSANSSEQLHGSAPLAERLRPSNLDEVVGQERLLGPQGTLRRLVQSGATISMLFWGPPGSGKTTIARLVATESASTFESLSAVSASVSDIRATAESARRRLGERSVRTVLFLDEIHRFTKAQQDALLPHTESGLIQLIGATTESPWATVNAALLSRCTILKVEAMSRDAAAELIARAERFTSSVVEPDAAAKMTNLAGGDARRLLTIYESALAVADSSTVTKSDVEVAAGASGSSYGRGEHYDSASALIKHMRASDPDQAMAWLVHMLDGGEDPMFVARRLVIFASEDIGEADRGSLLVATAALEAVRSVGMPEARYPLGHAVLTLAHAKKSRGVPEAFAGAATTIRRDPPSSP